MSLTGFRRVLKRRKPVFRRQGANKHLRLKKSSYRKPDGYTSDQRIKKKGNVKVPSRGYSSPKSVRGLHPSGKRVVMINSLKDLELVGKDCVGIISSGVGARKKLLIAGTAVKKKIHLANMNPEVFIKKTNDSLTSRKSVRKDLLKSRETKSKTVKEDKKKSKKDVKDLEVLEGTNKPVQKKGKRVEGADKEVVKGLR